MYRRILVAMDATAAGASAVALASNIAHEFGASIWLLQVSEHTTRRSGVSEKFAAPSLGLPESAALELQRVGITVSGANRTARDRHLVQGIAGEATQFEADVIVLGLDGHHLAHRRFSRSLQEQIAQATCLPVMIAPATTDAILDAMAERQPAQVSQ